MNNIVNDTVDEIIIKPNKTKLIIKWILSGAGTLIAIAFALGQFQTSFFNRMDKFEETVNENTIAIILFNTNMVNGFEIVDEKIDNVYDDGLIMFDDFQTYNNKQLELIIDYSNSNKDLLKKMLEINSLEKIRWTKNHVNQIKNKSMQSAIIISNTVQSEDYLGLMYLVEENTNDTTFQVTGANRKFINSLDRKLYDVNELIENRNHPGLYDFSYNNK